MSSKKILLVDDELDIIEFLGYNLSKEGYDVSSATSGKEAIELAKKIKPDLILLDVMMPAMDGIEICQEIRSIASIKDTLIAFLSARGEDYSQVAGLDAGADDYITKPIKPRLLTSRVKAILRRKMDTAKTTLNEQEDGIRIDREKYVVYQKGRELSFPKKEFELLALLISMPSKVFTREHILATVWGGEVIVGDRTIDVHIRRLREKLGNHCIKTIKGVGYKFETTR